VRRVFEIRVNGTLAGIQTCARWWRIPVVAPLSTSARLRGSVARSPLRTARRVGARAVIALHARTLRIREV